MVKNQTRIPQGARLNIHHRIPQLRSYLVHHSFLSYLPHLSHTEAPGGTTESRHSPSRCLAGRGPPLPCSHGRVRTRELTGDTPLAPRPGERRAHVQQQLICRSRRPGCDGVRVVTPHCQGHVQARELTGDACLCSPRPGARPGQEVPASTAP
jgi:hypothetical protein